MLEFILGTIGVLVLAAVVLLVTGRTVVEARKFCASLVLPIGALGALFLTGYDPGLTEALATLTTACFAPVLVFLDKNAGPDDYSKAVTQAINAGISVAGYVATISPSTAAAITALGGAIVSTGLVLIFPNEDAPLNA